MHTARMFWLAEAESYLQDCRKELRSVRAADFARRMKRTPAQLAREFLAHVGWGIKEYLSNRQVKMAKELLANTPRTTAEIAALTGYGTTRSFYRAFRRTTGASPTEYRKELSLVATESRP